ncbi:MAG: 4Fe-4S binding protein [Bacillota bacterium]
MEHLLKVIDPEPVLLDHQACLVARHKRSPCRACLEACPDQALRIEEVKVALESGKCSRCGVCAGACPTAAIALRGIDEAAVTGASHLHCSRTTGPGLQVPCLGYLTVDHLIGMALRTERVELTRGACATCPWSGGGAMAERAVATARQALAALGSSHQIDLAGRAAPGEGPERGFSRRELLNLWRVESVQVARQLMPEKEINHARLPARLPTRRTRWLRQTDPAAVQPEAIMPEGPWKARTVSEACNGCSICAAFCPTGAFAKVQEGERWALTHQPAACIACNTCVSLCPVRAIGEEPLPVSEMAGGAVREVARLTSLRCHSCRKEFKGRSGESRCPQCRSIYGMLRS